jgi:hypothetical protein
VKTLLQIFTVVCIVVGGITIGAYLGGARLVPKGTMCEQVKPEVDSSQAAPDPNTRLVWEDV